MEKKRLLFVVNSISHRVQGVDVKEIIHRNLDHTKFSYEVAFTQYAHHTAVLTQEAIAASFDIVAAVGGDGTVNEVGKIVMNSTACLAIIPAGSGDGLARHLGIPVHMSKAIQALNTASPIIIDTGKINDRVFLCAAGIGFDAHIAWKFAEFGRRGLLSYMWLALKEYPTYQAEYYQLTVDGKAMESSALMISFANGSQYGSNFYIAPKANLQDGFLDMVIMKDVPFYQIPSFLFHFRWGTLHQSSHVEIIHCQEVTVKKPIFEAHIDGEPALFQHEIKVSVNPASLKILV